MKRSVYLVLFLTMLFSFCKTAFAYIPNDPYISKQWYLDAADVYKAWDITKGSSDIIVAVIDSGVDYNHIDLKDNIWVNKKEIPDNGIDDDFNGYIDDVHGWDFVNNDNDPKPDIDVSCLAEKKCSLEGVNHGTVISGIIAGIQDNNEGISGIAPKVKIMPLKVLDPNGGGNIEDVISAIRYAQNNGASIINMSFVGSIDSSELRKVMSDAAKSNIIFTVAAGNNIDGGYNLNIIPMYPVCSSFDDMVKIGVSSIDKNDIRPSFANFGSNCIDFSAPGTSIFSTTVYKGEHSSFNSYYNGYWSGTSVSAPIVAGAIALIKSINNNLTNQEVYNILFDNSESLSDPNSGRKIDIYKSVKYAADNYSANYSNENYEIIASAGIGNDPNVNVIESNGDIKNSFLAYPATFKGGVNAIVADINGDFNNEIVVSPLSSFDSSIKIFDSNSKLIKQFLAYPATFKGGVNISSIDINADGEYEIITAPNKGYSPQVKIFDKNGNQKVSFLAYSPMFKGGVNVATCNLNGDSNYSIVTSPVSSGGSHIRIFSKDGKLEKEFFAYSKNIISGYPIFCADTNNDNKDEIIILNNRTKNLSLDIFNGIGNKIKTITLNEKSSKLKNYSLMFIKNIEEYKQKIILNTKGQNSSIVEIFDTKGNILSNFNIAIK